MIRAAALLALLAAAPADAAELVVTVTGGAEGRGRAAIAVFAAEADWMKRPVAQLRAGFGPGGVARATLDVPAGEVAVSVYWDRDDDGEIDTNFLGIPTEAFGFSNGASATFGPPGWSKAKLTLPQSGAAIAISLEVAD